MWYYIIFGMVGVCVLMFVLFLFLFFFLVILFLVECSRLFFFFVVSFCRYFSISGIGYVYLNVMGCVICGLSIIVICFNFFRVFSSCGKYYWIWWVWYYDSIYCVNKFIFVYEYVNNWCCRWGVFELIDWFLKNIW